MKILIDNGHGIDTPGKRSLDGVLREYVWNRLIASRIVDRFLSLGLDAKLLVPEERDISLPERCRRDRWYDATGWCAYTTRGNTNADTPGLLPLRRRPGHPSRQAPPHRLHRRHPQGP